MARLNLIVIGGGLVGLATAWAVTRQSPGWRVLIIEKENAWARHQSGRNSGVIHSGLYYKPGSLKAGYCRQGRRLLLGFCRAHGIKHQVCGKLVVAVSESELGALEVLRDRAAANGVLVHRLTSDDIATHEPFVKGVAALHVPDAGIVDYPAVARALAAELATAGAELRLQTRVEAISERSDAVTVETGNGSFNADYLVNCAGLHSDRIAAMMGVRTGAIILPFRGEYYELSAARQHLVNNLVYPVPNPRYPFLGVHFTRMIGGGVHCGPNAVLALRREGYTRRAISLGDTWEVLSYPGTWALAQRSWRDGMLEVYRSLSKQTFVKALRRLIPDLTAADLLPAASGVRAQAVAPDGALLDDFVLTSSKRSLHVVNAPSPAATASLALGEAIAARATAGTDPQVLAHRA